MWWKVTDVVGEYSYKTPRRHTPETVIWWIGTEVAGEYSYKTPRRHTPETVILLYYLSRYDNTYTVRFFCRVPGRGGFIP